MDTAPAFVVAGRVQAQLSKVVPESVCSRTRLAENVKQSARRASLRMDASAASSSPINGAETYRLSIGERARTVVHVCRSGTLCTSSSKHDGQPFGTHVDYVLDDEGRPVFLLASNAAHTVNLGSSPRCSLFCQPTKASGQAGCRATLVGTVEPVPAEDTDDVEELYKDCHPEAAEALRFPDKFSFYRIAVNDIYFVGGYGVTATWVEHDDYCSGSPDPLAFEAADIINSMNDKRREDLVSVCRVFLGLEGTPSVKMMGLDRLGFDVRVKTDDGDVREYRIAFRETVANRFDVQSALTKTLQECWERENGYEDSWDSLEDRPVTMYYAGIS